MKCVIIQMKATEQYLLKLYCGAVYYALQGDFKF